MPVTIENPCKRFKGFDVLDNLINDEFCDFLVTGAGGYKLRLHRCILNEQSSVFSDLFKNENFKELSLPNFTQDTLINFFKFIYTGKADGINRNLFEIHTLARRYAIHDLIEECLKLMLENYNLHALECLEISLQYKVNDLKNTVVEYLSSHIDEYLGDPRLKEILCRFPEVMFNILQRCFLNQDRKSVV